VAIPPLVLRIYADSSGVRAGVAQTQRQVGGLKNSISQNSALIKTAIIGGVVFGLKASVDAAREAATAQLKLQNSIQNSKVVSGDAAKAFTEQANALRDLTGVDDEAIIGAQAFLVQMGLTEQQIKTLTPLMVDLSVKMGVDLNTAAKVVGKSVNGTTGGLMKMGVIVDTVKAKTDAYGATLDALGVAQGFAAKQAKLEPWKQLGAQFEELLEVVGEAILPTLRQLTNILRFLLPVVRRLGPYLVAAAAGFAAMWTVGKLGSLAGAISATSTAMTTLGVAAFTAAGPIGIIVGLIAGTVALERSSSSALDRQTERLTALGFSAKEAGRMIEDEFNAALRETPGDLRSANMAVYDHVQAVERDAEVAEGWAMRQQAVQHELDVSKRKTQAYQATLHKFAGMTGKEQRDWATKTIDGFDAVGAALDNLADKTKLTADKIINQFERQARMVANYRDNLQTVAARNIPDVLLQQLIDMGIGGAAILDKLAGASDEKFHQIVQSMSGARQQTQGLEGDLARLRREAEKGIFVNIHFQQHGGPGWDPRWRATGGPVSSGRPYIVGERGPELFVPNSSGTVIPNHELNPTAAPQTINVYVGEEQVDQIIVRANRRTAIREAT
jgi:hypothetical protein